MKEGLSNSENLLTQDELISRVSKEGREYKKTATTKARQLTQKDFDERGGVIETMEGPVGFEVGDYLAVGIAGEQWPIAKDTFLKTKRIVETEIDEHEVAWGIYKNINTVSALQIHEPFQVQLDNGDILTGKSGDYFVYDGSSCWIVDEPIFKESYSQVTKAG